MTGSGFLAEERYDRKDQEHYEQNPGDIAGSAGNAAETQRLLDTSQQKLDAYQKAIDEAKAAGKSPDDISIRGYVYGLQRERKNVLSYTKELKAA